MAEKIIEEEKEPEKIKVGENEFTQEELDELIGSGRRLKEIETKQGQPIDDILKSWGKRGERLGQWKAVTGAKKPEELAEIKKQQEEAKKSPEQLSREELKEKVLAEAREFGLLTKEDIEGAGYLTKEEFERLDAGRRTLNQVKRVIKKNTKDGYPAVGEEELLKFMSDPRNPADPQNAYELMFKKEIREIEAEKINKLKGKPMYTNTKSTAGGKEYKPPKITDSDSLRSALADHFKSGGE